MDLKTTFGTHVRHHRKARGLTQEELAARVEVSVETIGKIERGAAAPSFETAERISAALKVGTAALFGAPADGVQAGNRGRLILRIQQTLANFNEEQLERAAKMLEAFAGR